MPPVRFPSPEYEVAFPTPASPGIRGRLAVVLLLVGISVPAIFAAAPEPPQNLAAVVAGNMVTLTWQASGAGSAPLGYLIEASLSPGGATIAAFLVVDTTIVLNAVPDGVY